MPMYLPPACSVTYSDLCSLIFRTLARILFPLFQAVGTICDRIGPRRNLQALFPIRLDFHVFFWRHCRASVVPEVSSAPSPCYRSALAIHSILFQILHSHYTLTSGPRTIGSWTWETRKHIIPGTARRKRQLGQRNYAGTSASSH